VPPTLSPHEIEALLAYARGKFEDERYPFAPALRPVREALAKIEPEAEPRTVASSKALCAERAGAC
jgi:hypothetical protein